MSYRVSDGSRFAIHSVCAEVFRACVLPYECHAKPKMVPSP